MRSSQAVTDPFLTLLVEVDALRTHTVREYTLLLDPPVFAPGEQQNAPVAAPSTGAGTREGAIARQAAPAPARPAERSSASPLVAPPLRARRRPARLPKVARAPCAGATRSPASRTKSASDSSQSRAWMLAIYQNNPAAFDGNMNVLRSGAVLRIPNASAVAAIAPSEATAEIRRQYASWRGGATPAAERVRAGPPASRGAGSPRVPVRPNAQADAALQGRVRDLEAQLAGIQAPARSAQRGAREVAGASRELSLRGRSGAPPPPAAEPTPPPAAAARPRLQKPLRRRREATPPAGRAARGNSASGRGSAARSAA